jgi:hypothetical protein
MTDNPVRPVRIVELPVKLRGSLDNPPWWVLGVVGACDDLLLLTLCSV